MFYYYDDAVVTKIKPLFANIFYARTEEAFEKSAHMNKGKVLFPMITFYADSIVFNKELYNQARHVFGGRLRYNDNNSRSYLADLPVKITYNMDVWAIKKEEVDTLSSELLFYLIDNPKFMIKPPMVELEYEFFLQIEDFNGTMEVVETGEYGRAYRYTVTFSFPEARVLRVRTDKAALDIEARVKN